MDNRRAAAACLIAGGGAVGVIALLRTLDAIGANVPFDDWFWDGTLYGHPVSGLWFVGGIMLGVGLSLTRRW